MQLPAMEGLYVRAGNACLQPTAAAHMYLSTASVEQVDAGCSLSSSMDWGSEQYSAESPVPARSGSRPSDNPSIEGSVSGGSCLSQIDNPELLIDTPEGNSCKARPDGVSAQEGYLLGVVKEKALMESDGDPQLSSGRSMMEGRNLSDLAMHDAHHPQNAPEGVTQPPEAIMGSEALANGIVHDGCPKKRGVVHEAFTRLRAGNRVFGTSNAGTGGSPSWPVAVPILVGQQKHHGLRRWHKLCVPQHVPHGYWEAHCHMVSHMV